MREHAEEWRESMHKMLKDHKYAIQRRDGVVVVERDLGV
jgi:hypothetical protein